MMFTPEFWLGLFMGLWVGTVVATAVCLWPKTNP